MDNGFTKEQAPEAPEESPLTGPFAGWTPGNDPDDGTTEDLGDNELAPSDIGAGAGANAESFATEVGGAIRGGNCCGPAVTLRDH